MNIFLPESIEERLKGDRFLRSAVDDALAEFDEWLSDSKLPFFPDYTDHGAPHLSNVLTTAVTLITPQAGEIFSSADAAVLVLATLLHDAAMHISEAGFHEIIRGSFASNRVEDFDQSSWPDVWESFLFSAKRWDDRQLMAVFGEGEDGQPRAYVSDPFRRWHNLTEGDRRLIGEFIRRNHARLAHEFATFGIPGPNHAAIKLSDKLTPQLRDLVGVVARSHGLPARACLDYLVRNHHKRETQKCHAVYLITLLRVADYLQVDSSRSPAIVFRYKHIPSATSRLEHAAHQAVTNITTTGDDPESIEIQAQPLNATVFLRLKGWLMGMQAEIDASWAVLGEVYGSQFELAPLGIRFRRVRSNLDDVKSFAEGVNYLPEAIRFDVARSELLKLLIRPLYGGKPSIGVRELMQNAVDAVRELHDVQSQHPALKDIDSREQDCDVEIWLAEPDGSGFATLTVSDRGIGMDATIVRDYFLRAGASYRQSERWKEAFENPPSEDESFLPKSRVLRSGRFGVGVLAAFLLGDEVRVLTRHAKASEGLEFESTLDADVIDVRKVRQCPVGTLVQVRVPPDVYRELMRQQAPLVSQPALWDWYQFTFPTVHRYSGRSKELLSSTPKSDSDNEMVWHRLPVQLPYSVRWSYVDAPALSCNGIFVRNSETIRRFPFELSDHTDYKFSFPNIAILDPDAHFPLTLQRDRFDGDVYPFLTQLVSDITRYSFAQILRALPPAADLQTVTATAWDFARTSGFFYGRGHSQGLPRDISETCLVWIGDKLSIYGLPTQQEIGVRRLLLVGDDARLLPADRGTGAVFWVSSFNRLSLSDSEDQPELTIWVGGEVQSILGIRIASKYRTWSERIREKIIQVQGWGTGRERNADDIGSRFFISERFDRWCVVESGDCPASEIDWTYLSWIGDVHTGADFALVEVFLKEPLRFNFSAGFVADLWLEIFEANAIAFSDLSNCSTLDGAKEKLRRFFPK